MVKRVFVKKVMITMLWLWFTIGAVGVMTTLLSQIISSLGFRMLSSNIRFPLGGVSSLVINQEGHIIVYSTDLSRLQIFDKKGDFLKGWYVPSASPTAGSSEMYLDKNQYIHLILLNDQHYVFNFEGDVLEHSSEKGIWKKVHEPYVPPPIYIDHMGNKYIFQDSLFMPRILRVSPEGDSVAIVSDSIYTLPCRGKLTLVFFFAFPGTILAVSILWSRKKRGKQNIESTKYATIS
jgi:hypothetical protein